MRRTSGAETPMWQASLRELKRALRKGDRDERCDAARWIAPTGSEAAVSPLVAALSDSDEVVRSRAAESLAEIDGDRALRSAVTAAGSADPAVRTGIARGLRERPEPEALSALRRLCKDPDAKVRTNAALALGSRGVNEIGVLSELAGDAEPTVSAAAVTALRSIGSVDLDARERVTAVLRRVLEGCSSDLLAHVAIALADLGDTSVIDHLRRLMSEPGPDQTLAAQRLHALGWEPQGVDAVEFCCRLGDRKRCAGLGEQALGPLLHLIETDRWDDAGFAADVLGDIGDPRAVPALADADRRAMLERELPLGTVRARRFRLLDAIAAVGNTAAIDYLGEVRGSSAAGLHADALLRAIGSRALDRLDDVDVDSNAEADSDQAALRLVAHGVALGDPRLSGVIRSLSSRAEAPDYAREGVDEDWKRIDSRIDRGDARTQALDVSERLVARWVSGGDADRYCELDVDAARARLFAVLELEIDWRTRGEVIALLVENDAARDDSRFARTIAELESWADRPDTTTESDDGYVTTTWNLREQREAARHLLARIGVSRSGPTKK